ncbi:Stk1 family PASTA domain-containing Ser/Thr kinase [Phytohabitans houttuyneae]|uniref:non-specific serine/threonine protein kinase n=1 Tax=Phytohabitans houttuyneae TaxID=1076126 RepID=A0A6V8KCJ3_9ACTN|nr:Stk1 family PASTA domain-containing Ser/Thr kinase [Phytohabitans houttuyneae]GFJ79829.1 serine/threonine protein kinase [Phytohabitans houttuyneae]
MTAQARLLGGRYQVGELLGYGGMAEVHRGRDLRLGRDVAIKMLRTDLARDQTFQMRFRREAQNAASLNHPAIVAVYDTGEEIAPTGETLPFIVMEFVNGRTLKEVLAAEGRLMPRRALEISADICAALEFSHRHGIIHRDIKPGNVMLTQNGQVKVMDFGIARALASGATTMTQTSAVIGTAQYLSPEQARGEAVDARSDVYAAGCVIFELLCGHPPFVGDSPVSVAYQHVREDPRAPSEINPEVNPDIDAIVLKALAKNPLNRYQSAQEMRADLLRAAAGRPVMATPVLRDAETVAMMGQTSVTRPINSTATRPTARVGDPRRRKASAWVLAALSTLGVLAVVALIAGLILSNQGNETPQTTVPNVIGLSPANAQADLRNAGLRPTVGEAYFGDDCEKGTVAKQSKSDGERVDRDTEVVINVCQGPQEVEIPDLVGSNRAAAEKRLTELGLRPDIRLVDSEAPENQVTAVPNAGKLVAKETSVVVEVSRGNIVPIPNVVGDDADSAQEELEAAGFVVEQVEGDPAASENKVGTVQRQSETGKAKKGTKIELSVFGEPEDDEPTTPPPTTPAPSTSTTAPPGTGGGTEG